jgi:hypothetical protein
VQFQIFHAAEQLVADGAARFALVDGEVTRARLLIFERVAAEAALVAAVTFAQHFQLRLGVHGAHPVRLRTRVREVRTFGPCNTANARISLSHTTIRANIDGVSF